MIDNTNLFYLIMVGGFLVASVLLLFWNRAREIRPEQMHDSGVATVEKSPLQTGPPEIQKQRCMDAAAEDHIQQNMWHYSIDGICKHGPITEEALRHLLNSRRLLPDTLVWTQELPYWYEASSCKILMASQESKEMA